MDTLTYVMVYLGSTTQYDVYHIVLYPGVLKNEQAVAAFKQQATQLLAHAKAGRRKAWVAANLSHLTYQQMISIVYRLLMPFIRNPPILKTYGIARLADESVDKDIGVLHQIMRIAFRHELATSREEAFPPDFVPPPLDRTTHRGCCASG